MIDWIQHPMTLTCIVTALENLSNSENRMAYSDSKKLS